MKQGRTWIAAVAAIAMLCAFAPAIASAASKSEKSGSSTTRKQALRQFSGWVTANDKGSLTVEKRGKTPKTVVFSKDADMRTTGEIQKDSRVTVYYRDEGGRTVAHKVVVKPANGRTTRATAKTAGS